MTRARRSCVLLVMLLGLTLMRGVAHAVEPPVGAPRALFALIIGVNASPDVDVAPLQYADDDAARYLDLFRTLGARTYVLSRLDANTRRLHAQAAAEAVLPRRGELRQVVAALRRDIEQARTRGVRTTLYVMYAGHGDVQDNDWYLTLEDARLGGAELSDLVEQANADQSHVIIDACHAYMLALPRGPGGTRRSLDGFVELEAASRAGRVGYLLSSSVSGESHEWAGFEAGVFSHEVRSGLYGAADADTDGQVTYAEIGAFVARANQTIANERFRPRILTRPPRDGNLLLDLRSRRDHALILDGHESGAHYLLENASGVRLLDFHGSGTLPVHLIRPAGDGPLYLRRVADGTERTVPRVGGVVQLAQLPVTTARAQTRGAAHHAFNQIFTLPFDGSVVAGWSRQLAKLELRRRNDSDVTDAREHRYAFVRRVGGIAALGAGVAAAITATALELSAHALHDDLPDHESQRDAAARNQRIDARNQLAAGLAIGAVAAGVAGTLLLLWPAPSATGPEPQFAASATLGGVQARWRF